MWGGSLDASKVDWSCERNNAARLVYETGCASEVDFYAFRNERLSVLSIPEHLIAIKLTLSLVTRNMKDRETKQAHRRSTQDQYLPSVSTELSLFTDIETSVS